jgi:integrase
VAGLFARDAGSTPAASTIITGFSGEVIDFGDSFMTLDATMSETSASDAKNAKNSAGKAASSGKSKPLLVKSGNVAVKIYASQNRVGDKVYHQFSVCYYDAEGKRIRKNFGDLEEAKTEAGLVATKLARGEQEALKLNSRDRAIYVEVLDLLKPLNVPLTHAVSQFVSVTKRLPAGVSLHDAVDFYLSRSPAGIIKRTVRQVVDEMVRVKEDAGKSDVHVKDMTCRLGQFADSMQMNIDAVTGESITLYLDGLKVNGKAVCARTKNNHLSHIRSLFRWAAKRKYLPKSALEELEAVEAPEDDVTEVEIFSPDELRDILLAARPELTAWLAIAAFAGLRNAELQRLDWSDVKLKERHIVVPAAKAKTRSRRIVPITDNLFAWLATIAQKSGPVTPFENMAKQIVWLVDDVNAFREERAKHERGEPVVFEWKRNAMRHSFISYRVAALKDVARVSLEAGNSPNMIFKHYRELVTEDEAARWFAVQPDAGAVLPMPASIAA